MPKQKTLEEAYCDCEAKGYFADLEIIDSKKIQSMLQLADTMYETAQDVKKNLDEKSPRWSVVYILHYDALRELADALILFNKKKIANHQCLFAFLCKEYIHLELSWEFSRK
jgi:hypothetical protein